MREKAALLEALPDNGAAILAPILLVRNDQLQLTISNPYLWGAVAAIVAAWKSGNIYWTVGIGMLVFIGAGQLF